MGVEKENGIELGLCGGIGCLEFEIEDKSQMNLGLERGAVQLI